MSHQDSPTVLRRRIKTELRTLWLGRNLTRRDVAEAMDWSTSKLIRIESGDVGVAGNDLRALLSLYDVDNQNHIDQLVGIAQAARTASSSRFRSVLDSASLDFMGYESSASLVRRYDGLTMPDLLQTEAWEGANISHHGHTTPTRSFNADLAMERIVR